MSIIRQDLPFCSEHFVVDVYLQKAFLNRIECDYNYIQVIITWNTYPINYTNISTNLTPLIINFALMQKGGLGKSDKEHHIIRWKHNIDEPQLCEYIEDSFSTLSNKTWLTPKRGSSLSAAKGLNNLTRLTNDVRSRLRSPQDAEIRQSQLTIFLSFYRGWSIPEPYIEWPLMRFAPQSIAITVHISQHQDVIEVSNAREKHQCHQQCRRFLSRSCEP